MNNEEPISIGHGEPWGKLAWCEGRNSILATEGGLLSPCSTKARELVPALRVSTTNVRIRRGTLAGTTSTCNLRHPGKRGGMNRRARPRDRASLLKAAKETSGEEGT